MLDPFNAMVTCEAGDSDKHPDACGDVCCYLQPVKHGVKAIQYINYPPGK